MLRTARSLPTIGAAYRQSVQRGFATVRKAPQAFPKDDLAVKLQTTTRSVHQTSKAQLLMDVGNPSKYTSMNLQGLKMECKRRGLKVSGRKIDLMQRLTQYDSSKTVAQPAARTITTTSKAAKKPTTRQMSSTASKKAKGDNSTIDFYKVDQKAYPPPDEKPAIKIPSLSTKASLKDKPIVKETAGTVSQVLDSAPVSKAGQILQTTKEKISESAPKQSSSDGLFFGLFGLFTLGWWSQKSKDGRH
ncbi:hypothetical protein OGAPHI_000525 [Ogataea philodendri]|uniref:SAP domain-containing protein n=1 Tax=Ogataea philodendri TaxID=1378263 RepID=A0A9P8PG93_9ASCO|nr:uncharacterized protein OGAPHI_000525 [Ogataea philodendri]KAH3671302.1 hypothetical protein OGAPHI_000525 [Ogataea philodendri]